MNTSGLLDLFSGMRKAAVTLALLAGLLACQIALAADSARFEAETLSFGSFASVTSDSSASGGKALRYTSNGTATKQITLSQDVTAIVVRAKGVASGGVSPELEIKLDGVTKLEKRVSGNAWADHEAVVAVPAGKHTIAVRGEFLGNGQLLYADVVSLPSKNPEGDGVSSPNPTKPSVFCDKWASLSGSNANAGTKDAPYGTAEYLANNTPPGGIGCLEPGIYTEGDKVVNITAGASSEAGRRVLTTAPSDSGAQARINGRVMFGPNAHYRTIENLRLDGSFGPTCKVAGKIEACGSPHTQADYTQIIGNEITNRRAGDDSIAGNCIYSNTGSGKIEGLVIAGNSIHRCGILPGTNHDHGIYLHRADGFLIRNNLIWDNADRGIQLRIDSDDGEIYGNIVDGNGQAILFGGTSDGVSERNYVHHNLFTFSVGNPINRAQNITSFYESGASPPTGANTNVVTNNCIFGVAAGGTNINTRNGGFITPNNSIEDPLYTDRVEGDFSLRQGSPCASILNGG